MKYLKMFMLGSIIFTSATALASESKSKNITDLVTKKEFSTYKHVGDFIENSPKVTVLVKSDPDDISTFGKDVVRSLTGSDCDRDGKMDDNSVCNAVYYKLWLSYER